jgi:DNA mismatch repair protein MutS
VGLTPMMQQYLETKKSCKDCILFFRLGDFYEMFFEDAELASKELELVLTGRDCGLENRAPMCGIPYHAASSYIGRLVSKGYKVAICEQLEDPAQAKGIVKRGLIKVITPGTYTDSMFLDDMSNNYLMCVVIKNEVASVATADITTGEFNCTDFKYSAAAVLDEISKYSPKEILFQNNIENNLIKSVKERFNITITEIPTKYFKESYDELLLNQFISIDPKIYSQVLKCSAGCLLEYILETQKTSLSNINNFNYYEVQAYMGIDINSRRNLELTENLREKNKKGSLLWVLDKTNTAMGARLLRKWVEQPLISKNKIEKRLNAVEEISASISLYQDITAALKKIYDIERIAGKISGKSVNAKELLSLKFSLEKVPEVKKIIENCSSKLISELHSSLDEMGDVYSMLDCSIIENPPLSVKDGGIIKSGYSAQVDELREAKANGKKWISKLESTEKQETGIKSLKVGYNKVFGYYLEITKSNLSMVPEGRYIRKQTLSNAERYITPELKEMENKILGAEEKLIDLEYSIFMQIRESVEAQVPRLQKTAAALAKLDCIASLSAVALENNYSKPEINDMDKLYIKEGRHPVVEKMIPDGSFVSNDSKINTTDEQLILITGPNMAGKSTYMRQVALIVIMAQIGSFVPAEKAEISICDRVFTRIGASDDLSGGKSTFMVEMWEVSSILENATNKSLVLLDEVGRGTSTYDGLSIAWSVIEYIATNKNLKCKTLFATHYHEHTKLAGLLSGIKNYSFSVKEFENEIVFLRKIVPGGAQESYGIEVAKLAGLPDAVIERAKEILKEIKKEKESLDINSIHEKGAITLPPQTIQEKKPSETLQLSFNDFEKESLLGELKSLDILSLTPMDGFNKLYELACKAKLLR